MLTAEAQKKGQKSGKTTTRHRLALKEIVESRGKSISQALLRAGYSIPTVKNPKQVIQTKGFQQLIRERGLTEEFVTDALKDDIQNKPRKRVEELKLAADILRMRGSNTAPGDFTPTQIHITQINLQGSQAHESHAPIPTPHRTVDTAPQSTVETKDS